jgi:hypothetical protein
LTGLFSYKIAKLILRLIEMTNTKQPKSSPNSMLQALEALAAETCFCKLREKCTDKTSPDCLKHRNMYAEAMLAREKAIK